MHDALTLKQIQYNSMTAQNTKNISNANISHIWKKAKVEVKNNKRKAELLHVNSRQNYQKYF
jgi:hypothetical protein